MKAQNGYTGHKIVKNVNLYNAHGEIEKTKTPITLYERTIEFKSGSWINTLLNLAGVIVLAVIVYGIWTLFSTIL